MVYYFPWYVGFVLVPMVIRLAIERVMGVRSEVFYSTIHSVSLESAFMEVVLAVFYYPFFEELIFRGLPYLFFGFLGVVVGSLIWVVMHPAWQLRYLSSFPLKKKVGFLLTSSWYYSMNAVFYTIMWLNSAGLAAILYHMLHNGWLTFGDILKEVELPAPWKKLKRPSIRVPKPKIIKKRRGTEEAGEEVVPRRFVIRKGGRSLEEEAEEVLRYVFVRRKIKNEE